MALSLSLLLSSCGGGNGNGNQGDEGAWCKDLDRIVELGWTREDGFNYRENVYDMSSAAYGHVKEYMREYTAEELDDLKAALDDAATEGIKYDGREGGRAWEQALRDAC